MSVLSRAKFQYDRWKTLRDAQSGLAAPTPAERVEIARLQSEFAALDVAPTEGRSSTEADWNSAMNRLRELGETADPRAFQRWDVIVARMAHVNSPATPVELAILRADPNWAVRWMPAIREVATGRPFLYNPYPATSEVAIQTAYNIYRLENLSGRRVEEWETIVEFGGGFGGMCRIIHALGFTGRYMIFDLPPFSLLQRYYLANNGVPLHSRQGVQCTSSIAELEAFVGATPLNGSASFWATWSLSEAPVVLREQIKPLVQRLGAYCIAFQGSYGEVNNLEYFTNQWESSGKGLLERIGHRPDDYYMSSGV